MILLTKQLFFLIKFEVTFCFFTGYRKEEKAHEQVYAIDRPSSFLS
jgi:hypothetical protein